MRVVTLVEGRYNMTLGYISYKFGKLKKERIIKRKTNLVDFTIHGGIYGFGKTRITIESDEIRIGWMRIKMSDLKTIYIYTWTPWRRGISRELIPRKTTYKLEFVGKNFFNSIGIDINSISEKECEIIEELFDYFMFSNEVNSFKLTSEQYVSVVNSSVEIKHIGIRKYNDEKMLIRVNDNRSEEELNKFMQDISQNSGLALDSLATFTQNHYGKLLMMRNEKEMCLDNKKYVLIKILPKSFYRKYMKKSYLIYESLFANINYIDVWIEKEVRKRTEKRKDYIKMIVYNLILGSFILIMLMGLCRVLEVIIRAI